MSAERNKSGIGNSQLHVISLYAKEHETTCLIYDAIAKSNVYIYIAVFVLVSSNFMKGTGWIRAKRKKKSRFQIPQVVNDSVLGL